MTRIDQFAVIGHSGGGALLPDRVLGVVSMGRAGTVRRRGAARRTRGRAAKERFEASGAEYDPEFTSADLAALSDEWCWLATVVGPAVAAGPGGLIDDDLAYVAPWGFDPTQMIAPSLFVHGGRDRVVPSSHSEWLARRCPAGELRLSPDDGHISVVNSAAAAMDWLRAHAE